MRKIKEVLRLRAEGRSDREVARSVKTARTTVRRIRRRAEEAGLSWPLPDDLTESALEALLFPPRTAPGIYPRPVPDCKYIHAELRRKGVTLHLLWLEYKAAHSDGYQYSRFCDLFREWKGCLDPVLRQEHKAGEKIFVDYAGQTVPVADPETGEIREAQIFVGVLGASNFTFAEATWTQTMPDWTASHVRMFGYFSGVSELLIPDNLASGVSKACRYDPEVNPTYRELAVHYGTSVLPARPRRPRDKAKVESGVLVAERWILAPLRNHTFFSLAELNREIRRLLDALNDRPFQKLDGTRRSLFESVDRPALKPLPTTRYEYADWRKARVNIDYHIAVEKHFYSVPHRLVRKQVEVRLTASTVEVLHDGHRVAAHVRSRCKGGFSTDPTHRPKAHQEHVEWTPSRMIRWAQKTGSHTAAVVTRILEERPHPEQGYRPCLGILRLGERYSPERLEAACHRALVIRGVSYRSIKSILEHDLDRVPLEEQASLELPQEHDNVRGPDYYTSWH
ncbi:MAG: IS21 family transposase [Longimicrobiales bacterium]